MTLKLDLKDKKILHILDMDARESYSQIAKKVGLSKEVVNYRIKNLEKKGIVKGYYVITDMAKLGYASYRILLSFQNISEEQQKKIINYAKKNISFGWVATLEGRWNVVIIIWAKNVYEFKNIYDRFMMKFSKFIQKRVVTIATAIHHFKKNYLYGTKDYSTLIFGNYKEKCNIDVIDFKILLILSQNARTPILTLAKKSKLTPNAINYRLKNLKKRGIILGYRAAIDVNKLGYQHFKVFLMLQNITKEGKKRIMEYLKQEPNIVYLTEAIGKSDIEFEAEIKNSTKLYDFIKKVKVDFPNLIKDYQVILTYEEHRINYLPKYVLS